MDPELIGSNLSFWLFGTAACMLTLSNLEPMESFRKVAWIDTLPGPVFVGCSEMVRSFLEYATTDATIRKAQKCRTYGNSEREEE